MADRIYVKTLVVLALTIGACGQVSSDKTDNNPATFKADDELENEVQTLEVKYFGWMCPCPQWISVENLQFYQINSQDTVFNGTDTLFWELVPKYDTLPNPFDLTTDYENMVFRVKGQFFVKPQTITTEKETYSAKTFQYEQIEFVGDKE